MSLYSRLDRIAADVEKLNRQVNSVANAPQSQRTSVEGGSIDFNDADGNLKAIVGMQDDGGYTTNVVSGPTPPTPANFTVEVDHGKIVVHWDGTFENALVAPTDWARAEVYAQEGQFVTPSRELARGSMVAASGGEVTIGVLKGQWTVCMAGWSQAGIMSPMSAPVTVDVPGYGDIVLTEIDAAETVIKNAGEVLVTEQDTLNDKLDDAFGQIEDAIVSANGKNVVHYEDRAPTVDDAGTDGDTWFVGEVGRGEELLATNLAKNPSFNSLGAQIGSTDMYGGGASTITTDTSWSLHGGTSLKVGPGTYNSASAYIIDDPDVGRVAGKTWTISATLRLDSVQTDSASAARTIRVGYRRGGGINYSYAVSSQAPNMVGEHRLSVTFSNIPSDADSWFVRLFNGSASSTMWFDDLVIEESSSASPYFDGDTEDGETDNDPHYRWTGTPHASTSEKYLPATEGLSSNWNVTEQYRFVNGAWENVELSHTVLSSLDLGKLVAGSAAIKEAVVQKLWAEVVVTKMAVAEQFIGENAILTGAVTAPKITASEELWAKIAQFVKIRAEHIEADAIDGMVITGPNIRTAASGARVQMDPNGIRVFNGDNDVRTHLSPDGSTFKGEVEADTLVVNEGAEFKGNNTLAQGAKFTLAAGVTDPTAPPVVQPYWEGVEFDMSWSASANLSGLAFDGTNYWTVKTTGAWIVNGVTGLRAIRITPTGDHDLYSLDGASQGFSEFFGVTCIGSELFWLYRSGYKAYVLVTDLSCNKLREWEYPELGYSATNPLTYKPAIGNDGTNIVIAHCTDLGSLRRRTYNKTTGAQIGETVDAFDNAKSDITGVYVGQGDFGATRSVFAFSRSSSCNTYTTAGAWEKDKSWGMAASGSVGIVYADGKWRTLDPSGVIHEYADPNTGDDSGDWWATYYWYTDVDDDNVIESSDYQSRMAPPARFVWPRRAMLKILGQPMPTGVEALGPALAKKTSTPTRTDFHGPGWSVDAGKSSARYTELPTNWTTFASPSATNTFPEAASSVLESASGTFRLQGDGSGHWGPLTMGRNGIMSGLVVYGEQVGTVDAINTPKKTAVTFPSGRFTKPPVVWVIPSTGSPYQVFASVLTEDITTSGFQFSLARTNNTANTTVRWFAMDSE